MARKSNVNQEKLTTAQRREKCLQFRALGLSYAEIARQLNISRSTAHDHVEKGYKDLTKKLGETAETALQLELTRLDDALMAIMASVKRGDLKAIDRLIKISERRSRFLGLDKPSKLAHTDPSGDNPAKLIHELSDDEIDRRIAELAAKVM